jgi:preprotein translocase subunit SecG
LESLIFIIIFVLTTIPLFILGLFIKKGKGLMLIAGYNTLSKEERDKVNKEELSRTVGNLLIRMAIEILLLGVAINYRLKWAIVILI